MVYNLDVHCCSLLPSETFIFRTEIPEPLYLCQVSKKKSSENACGFWQLFVSLTIFKSPKSSRTSSLPDRPYFSTHVFMHAKLLQSCPTLWDPMDCSLLGLSVPGILQARILEWLAIAFSRVSTHGTYYFLHLKFPCGLIYSKWLPPCTDETHGKVEGHTAAFPSDFRQL